MKIVKLEKSLTEQAYEILLDKICFGELKSGERRNQD
jgi:DNA-binding GntR family transcriptional regulator